MTAPGTTTVRVRITVEVALGSTWGADCTTGQVHAQGMREARAACEKVISADTRIRIVDVAGVDLVVHCAGKP